jgi:HSP20 family molecular chaperone IbpA
MALFQRAYAGEDPSFTNLFRLLDDFDSYSREVQGVPLRGQGRRHLRRAFNPKFDVRETENAYELHGELPGIERENVSIEFTEPQTLVISGRVERNYSSGTPPTGALEDTPVRGRITEEGENSHKASVADEEAEAAKERGTPTPATDTQTPKTEAAQPKEKFWHQERSIGEFHRTFNFPARIDESGVSANLKNGILHVTIPKATTRESRRITIE